MAAIIETGRKRLTRGRYLLCCCCCCTSEGSSLGLTSKASALPANASAATPQPSSTLYAAYVDRYSTPTRNPPPLPPLCSLNWNINQPRPPPRTPPQGHTSPSVNHFAHVVVPSSAALQCTHIICMCIVIVFGPTTATGNERGQRAPIDHKQSRILINLVPTWLSNVKTSSAAVVSLASIGRAFPRKPKSVNPVETFDESPRRSN